jgi:hypothetical protein
LSASCCSIVEAFAGGGAAMQGLHEMLHAIQMLRETYNRAKDMFK